MKRWLPIFLLLGAVQALAQEPLDSAFLDAEIEDSISAMSIKPIKRPKKLLDSIIVQVILDPEQKPLVCKYRTACTTGLHTSGSNTSSCILHAIANIRIKSTGKGEEFRYDGPRRLTNLYDTASVYSALKSCLDGDYMLGLVQKCADETSVFQSFKYLMSLHHIKVYRISDEKGRGVYRVDFSPRKTLGMAIMALNIMARHISTGISILNKSKQTKLYPHLLTLWEGRPRLSSTQLANTIGWISKKSTASLLSNRLKVHSL